MAYSMTLASVSAGWFNRGKDYGKKALDIFKDTILSEFKGLASDVGGELSSITNYDTSDIKGLLDNVDKDKIKKLVEKVRPLIPEYYEKAKKMATDIFNQGKREFDKIKEEVENEVKSPNHSVPNFITPHHTAPHRTAPRRTAPHRTAPHRTAPHLVLGISNPGHM